MLNTDLDGYTKTLTHPTKLEETQKKQQPTENRKHYVGARYSHLVYLEGESPLCPG